ncbi:MAG TPA: metal ABC transporter ATP-binding protein [Bacillus sp. (in: firmicutes)]|uniref:metal ABC transporter ATP-binding protein n=1 Tax=Bacillus litorisediminis TaxID=2922713 RepID=UPI001FAE3302|nr:metal ABC transporter ATP-binding protein [Bacillus litorisediminis]HWO77662.1 metal ABC transporter ATP-binding protein [Bacillus sp. (in: firmicutes)]
MTQNVIEINDLSYRYDDLPVLEHINLSVPKGSFLGLVGPNGSGKSTLLKLILGLLKPQEGSIRLFGTDSKSFNQYEKIGYVSQKANSFNSGFPATVLEVVLSGLTKKIGLFKFPSKQDKQKALEAIRAVEMDDFLHRNIGELSGGQQQRVFIARAVVSDPELLILDEPTVGVDIKRVEGFYELLERLNRNHGITMILVTHDVGTITSKVSHVACLNKHLHFHGQAKEFEALEQTALSGLYGHDIHLLTHQH